MNMEEKLQAAVTQVEADGYILHTVVHGNDATIVKTENGNVPTLSKQLKDVRDEITSGVNDVVSKATEAKNQAITAKDNALTIKNAVDDLKNETKTYRDQTEGFKNQAQTTFSSISTATQDAIQQLQLEKTTQVNNISSAGTTQISNVNSAGATQIALAKAEADRAKGYADNMEVKDQSVYQAITTIPETEIILTDETVIYQKTVSSSTSFTFNKSGLTKTDRVITFELFLTLSASSLTMYFPSSVKWLNGISPTTSNSGKYLYAFRSFDNGSSWIGNLQGFF